MNPFVIAAAWFVGVVCGIALMRLSGWGPRS